MKISKSKLIAIAISVGVASTAAGAANNYMDSTPELTKPVATQQKGEVTKVDESVVDEATKEPDVTDTETATATQSQPSQAQSPQQAAPQEASQETPQPAQQPTTIAVDYVEQPPQEIPVVNKNKIMRTETTDYPNVRYPNKVDQKCVYYMEDGQVLWMIATIANEGVSLCFTPGTIMSSAQYAQHRTDPIPEQWR